MTAPGIVGVFVGQPITRPDSYRLAAWFKAVADPARLQILAIITATGSGGISGVDVEVALNRLSQPTVAHHLRILEAGGFIRRERVGRFVSYTTNKDAFTALADTLHGAR